MRIDREPLRDRSVSALSIRTFLAPALPPVISARSVSPPSLRQLWARTRTVKSAGGRTRPGRACGKSCHVRGAPKAEVIPAPYRLRDGYRRGHYSSSETGASKSCAGNSVTTNGPPPNRCCQASRGVQMTAACSLASFRSYVQCARRDLQENYVSWTPNRIPNPSD
jgi:hypothetical protein